MTESCETCKFLSAQGSDFTRTLVTRDGQFGAYRCRRFPQEVAKFKDEWCGEWRSKEESP